MSEINVYKWEDIRKYFPPERVAEIRAKILELRKSGEYTDRELWEMYGMRERTFYDLVERAIETLQYEFINLQCHATFNDFQNFLVIAKNGYNLREHSSFNYRSPLEIWNSSEFH